MYVETYLRFTCVCGYVTLFFDHRKGYAPAFYYVFAFWKFKNDQKQGVVLIVRVSNARRSDPTSAVEQADSLCCQPLPTRFRAEPYSVN